MPVRIRLSRRGAKKRPFYRIVVADSRRARDGKFIEKIGTYNPMLQKDNPERVKLDVEKAKEWIARGAQPSDRVTLFLSNLGVVEKPIITEKTKKHLPKKKTQEKLAAAKKEEETSKAKEKEESATEKTVAPADKTAQADSAKSDETNKEDVPAPEVVEDSNSESKTSEKTVAPADKTAQADSVKSDEANKEDVPAPEVVEDSNSETSNEPESKTSE
jgi:small subunit ribosomal protein S16